MSAIRVYVAAPKALASEVDAFHRWAHSHVAETRGRDASLEFTSTGWVQAVLESKGVDPKWIADRLPHVTANRLAMLSSNVMLAWTAVGAPRETFFEIGWWAAKRGEDNLIVAGSDRNAFISDSRAGHYIDASSAPDELNALQPYWPRMVDAIFNVVSET